MRFTPIQLVSAAQFSSNVESEFALEYVNLPGSIGFNRPTADHDVMGLQQNGMLKLVSDNALSITSASCGAALYDDTLVAVGPQSTNTLTTYKSQQAKYVPTGQVAQVDGGRLVFNGGSLTNTITVNRAGVVAICYCASPGGSSQACFNDAWVLAAHVTVRGPELNLNSTTRSRHGSHSVSVLKAMVSLHRTKSESSLLLERARLITATQIPLDMPLRISRCNAPFLALRSAGTLTTLKAILPSAFSRIRPGPVIQ